MKIALINGSPKVKYSASELILNELKNFFNNSENEVNKKLSICEYSFRSTKLDNNVVEEIINSNVLVFAFPLYVDGVPSHLLKCLVQLEEIFNNIKEKDIKVYALANCGFYEGEQNKLALEIFENWCIKCNLIWGQGVGIGAGPILHSVKNVPIGHGPKKNLGKALNIISDNIIKSSKDNNIFVKANFPRFAYKIAGEMGWKKAVKVNNLQIKDLYKRL
jgi:hypothetical protein